LSPDLCNRSGFEPIPFEGDTHETQGVGHSWNGPEAIKLAPVILALRADQAFECHLCVTAQHREMLDQVLTVFGIVPDTDSFAIKELAQQFPQVPFVYPVHLN
jgi:UDP-N-acetylglucosamine 2-epimerase